MSLIERFTKEHFGSNGRLLGVPVNRIQMIRLFSVPIGHKIVICTCEKYDYPELITHSSDSFTFGYDDKWFSYLLPKNLELDNYMVFQNQNKDELTLLLVKLEFLR